MTRKIIITITLILTFVACGKKETEVTKSEIQKAVKTIVLKKEILRKRIEGATTLEAKYVVNQTSPGGEVLKKNYKNGDRVKKDDIILTLKDDVIDSNYIAVKASYLNAEAQYEKVQKFAELETKNAFVQAQANYVNAEETLNKSLRGGNPEQVAIAKSAYEASKIALEQATSTLEKNTELYKEKLISEDQYLAVKTSYNQANSQYSQAKNNLELLERGADLEDINILRASLEMAKSTFEIAKKNVTEKTWEYNIQSAKTQYLSLKEQYRLAKKSYDDLKVKAKTEGLITNLKLKMFDEVTDEDVLFTLINDKEMEFSIGINLKDIIEISKGNNVDIKIRDLNKTFTGKITEINPNADSTDRKYLVKGVVENNSGILKNGMYTTVTIYGNEKSVIAVPKEALVIKGLYKYIFIVENGKAKRITVELGADYGDEIEVLSNDIKEGQDLVVEGQFLLENNDKVKEVK